MPERQAAEAVFDQVYSEHRQALHAYLVARTGDPEVALDLLQETFLRVWRNLQALQAIEPGERRYWLFTVARNALTDHYRRVAARPVAVQEPERMESQRTPAADEPGARLEAEEELELVDRAIRGLPEDLRTILLLQVLAGMTSSQIGEALGWPAGTVRYQLWQARRQLTSEMERMMQHSTHGEGGQ